MDPDGHTQLLDQLEAELAAVEQALSRLDDGTYGVCESCGELIPAQEIAAAPLTHCCARHRAGQDPGGAEVSEGTVAVLVSGEVLALGYEQGEGAGDD